ncbi:hypothetical protein [Pseudoduganella lutea]|uniref:TIGR02270 family protein n=1 Tax=Pseudoduganella lutea TaxID=321985 RepID=A0A4P6L4W2_9BURK|nr:hypothetical protein [Pseudoduganella lutea]QBE66537.1 hypothetical protein EWM63_29180 [Pseudoduganella lutea]
MTDGHIRVMKQSLPAFVEPLVRRYVEDAAFYWAQHDTSAQSTHAGLAALTRFSHLLRAHLEALGGAGAHAWPHCYEALVRWKKPAEAFVSAWVALSSDEPAQVEALMKNVRARPQELLRGVISAFAWLPPAAARERVAQWTKPESDNVEQVAALRAAAVIGAEVNDAIAQPLAVLLASTDEHVRAAACRVAAHADDAIAILEPMLADPALAVRAEAAIALALAGSVDHGHGVAVLWDCVASQSSITQTATGWFAKKAHRRLARWVRHLALMDLPGTARALDELPPESRLTYFAWHGDPGLLSDVVELMRHPEVDRYAGWVWQTITGVDIAVAGLAEPEQPPEGKAGTPVVTGPGGEASLAVPDADAIARYPVDWLEPGRRYLAGQPRNRKHALALLMDAPQAVRSIAAGHLRVSDGERISVRSCGITQRLSILRHADDEGAQ